MWTNEILPHPQNMNTEQIVVAAFLAVVFLPFLTWILVQDEDDGFDDEGIDW